MNWKRKGGKIEKFGRVAHFSFVKPLSKEDAVPYKAIFVDDRNGQLYIFKIFYAFEIPHADFEKYRMEYGIIGNVEHPGIVKFYGVIKLSGNRYILVYEYISDVSLLDYSKEAISEKKVFKLMKPVIEAISYLHDKHLALRNINLNSFFVSAENKVILTDFSKAIVMDRLGLVEMEEPPDLLNVSQPPEISWVNSEKYDAKKLDVWSLGVCLYRMINGSFPEYNEIFSLKLNKEKFSERGFLTIKKMLYPNPNLRISISEILKSQLLY